MDRFQGQCVEADLLFTFLVCEKKGQDLPFQIVSFSNNKGFCLRLPLFGENDRAKVFTLFGFIFNTLEVMQSVWMLSDFNLQFENYNVSCHSK